MAAISTEVGQFKTNPWVDFLRKYGPATRNDNMYDERIQHTIRKSQISAIDVHVPSLASLIDNFRSSDPKSVILTGTAGDGKTYLCCKVWESIGGDREIW